MKPELQVKFLQHLNRKKNNEEGFTLIELLVVVIIIGILAAIALPSLLGQVNKAKQAEAKEYTGSANRAQQAYYLENSGFATTLTQLQVGIKTQTTNYYYTIAGSSTQAIFDAYPQGPTLKSYYGEVATLLGNAVSSEALTTAISCEALVPGYLGVSPNSPNYNTNNQACDPNYTSLAK